MPLCVVFFVVDLAFFGATLFKIPDGGWFPLVVGVVVFTILSTWRTGRHLVHERLLHGGLPLTSFVESLSEHPPVRTKGAGAYLFATPGVTPPALLANLRHTDALHEQVLVISVVTEKRPRVPGVQACRGHRPGARLPRDRPALRVHGDARRAARAGRPGRR